MEPETDVQVVASLVAAGEFLLRPFLPTCSRQARLVQEALEGRLEERSETLVLVLLLQEIWNVLR